MRRITWRKNLQTWVAALGVTVLTGSADESLLERSVVVAAEDLVKDAATVEEVAKAIDLLTLPLPEGAVMTGERQLGRLNYETSGDLKSALEFQKKQFVKQGWKELPGGKTEATYSFVNYQKSNFVVSVMSYAGSMPDKKTSQVFINNLGNVRLSKLPVVKGAKSTHSTDAFVGYTTDLKPVDAADATRKLLLDSGWEPYGSNPNPPDSFVMTFKRNAIRLNAFAGIIPGQGGKVTISYNTSVLTADIPAPLNAKEVGFNEGEKTLQFQSPDTFEAVAKFYQQRLVKMGWKPTTDALIKTKYGNDRPLATLVFRNESKDVLSLDLTDDEGQTQAKLRHLTAAEIVAAEKSQRAAAEKLVAENKALEEAAEAEAAEEAAEAKKVAQKSVAKKPAAKSDDGIPDADSLIKGAVGDALKGGKVDLDKLTKSINAKAKDVEKKAAKGAGKAPAKDAVGIPVPDGAKKVTQTSDNVLQIKLPAGKGQAAAEFVRDQLLAADWEADDDDDEIDETSGNVTFKKAGKTLTLSFVDTGLADVNLMLIGIGVKVEPGKADPKAKVTDTKSKPKVDPDDEPTPAKKMAKKKSKSDSDDDVKPVVEPKRVEKPKRDIAKLDKLPNAAKVIANDEPIALPHLVAYEVISGDRWVTKVVATEKPIRQASLLAALQKTGTDEGLEISSPRITLELDDQDHPDKMSYTAPQTIGSASSSGLIGEAIVEAGRARGTFKSKKASEFFGRTITGEISFDLPVLTRHDKPTKQLADAPKLENSGKLLVNDKPVKLGSVIAYQVKVFDDVRTAIFFTEKPINMAKLKASLAKDGSDNGLFESQSQVKIEIDKDDRLAQMHLWHDNASLNSNSDLVGEVIVEDGRARGTVKLGKPTEFFGKTFSFELTFDVEVLKLPTTDKE